MQQFLVGEEINLSMLSAKWRQPCLGLQCVKVLGQSCDYMNRMIAPTPWHIETQTVTQTWMGKVTQSIGLDVTTTKQSATNRGPLLWDLFYSTSHKICTWFVLCIGAVCSVIYYGSCVHYNNVIMSVMASKIASLKIVNSTVCSGADRRKHQNSESPMTGEFPPQRAINAENVSIWWRHHFCTWTCHCEEWSLHCGCELR